MLHTLYSGSRTSLGMLDEAVRGFQELREECRRRQEEVGRLQAALSEPARQLEERESASRGKCQVHLRCRLPRGGPKGDHI